MTNFLLGDKPPSVPEGNITPLMQQYINQYTQGTDAANAANLRRFGRLQDLMRSSIKDVRQGSNQNRKDIRSSARSAEGEASQNLAARGLYNTTIMNSAQRGIREGRDAMLNRERDMMHDRVIGRRDALAGVIERRNDVGPDPGFYAQLLQGMGAANMYNSSRQRSGGLLGALFG
jgi:hypothetical protein